MKKKLEVVTYMNALYVMSYWEWNEIVEEPGSVLRMYCIDSPKNVVIWT